MRGCVALHSKKLILFRCFTVETTVNTSMMGLFFQAGPVVKVVMLVLLLMSVISWTIICNKFITLQMLKRKSSKFLQQITDPEVDLVNILERAKGANDIASKLFVIAVEEVQELKKSDVKKINQPEIRQELEAIMFAKCNIYLMDIERNLGFLATVGSSAVFIGLFGTVWGIMDSFQSISVAKNTSLAVVAPGIAEALLATAMGLVAAIPAKVFYNKFMADINRITVNSDALIPCICKKILSEAKK